MGCSVRVVFLDLAGRQLEAAIQFAHKHRASRAETQALYHLIRQDHPDAIVDLHQL